MTDLTLVWGSTLRSEVHVKIQSKKFPEYMDPYELGQVSYGGKSGGFFYGWIGFVLQELEVHKYSALVRKIS